MELEITKLTKQFENEIALLKEELDERGEYKMLDTVDTVEKIFNNIFKNYKKKH